MKKEKTAEIIGTREVVKGIDNGTIKKVVIANNCPDFIIKKIEHAKNKVPVEKFNGNQQQLGTHAGKPFPVAVVGYTE